jgi:leader peptidase (prepilin peptidase) / N-methyltransferase
MGSMDPSQQKVLFVFSGILGLLIGSFLNVCIFRLPRHCMSIVKPRSRCPKCLNWIAWFDNLPVLSWVALGGKCRHCKNPISVRYALVELLTGALFLYAGWRAIYASPFLTPAEQAGRFVIDAWFISAMVICTFVDLDFRIIPDEISLSGILLGLAASLVFPAVLHPAGLTDLPVAGHALPKALRSGHFAALTASAVGAVVGAGTIYVVGVLGKILFRKRVEAAGEDTAMGLGDVKFMAMAGAVLGWRGVLCTLLVACLGGAIFGVGKLVITRRMGFVAFGPFLAAGALTLLFLPGGVDAALRAYMSFNQSIVDWLMRR